MNRSKDVASIEATLDSLPEDDRSRVPLLLTLLLLDGHDLHEDIVFDLGLLGDPTAIPAIAKVAEAPPTYIAAAGEWTLHPFQRKCAYALARIGTPESRQVLEHFAAQGDSALSEYGKEGLGKWPMPYSP
jgi:HEAT repeat protein